MEFGRQVTRRLHVLVLRTGALGDFVATLPVLDRLREEASFLTVVAPARYDVLFSHADRWVDADSAVAARIIGGIADLTEVDLAIAWTATGADGLRRSGVRQVLEGEPRPPPGVAVSEHLWKPLGIAGFGARDRQPRLTAPEAASKAMNARLCGARPVVISPGSGGARKRWPIGQWRQVAAALARPVVWVAGPIEAGETGWGDPRWTDLDLTALVALAGCCHVWLAPDSGPAHLAAAAGARVGVVFTGETSPENWAPPGAHVFTNPSPTGVASWARGERPPLRPREHGTPPST